MRLLATQYSATLRQVLLVLLGLAIMVLLIHSYADRSMVNKSDAAADGAALTGVNCSIPVAASSWPLFYDLVEQQQPCAESMMFGGIKNNPVNDGAKYVCMDAPVAPRGNGQCLVLSFGINNEFSFDDAMAAWGCTVYAFDPTMGASDHQRGERIFFHSLGLSDREGNITVKKKKVPVESYRGILQHIGQLNSIIDYLKIDIEGSEMGFFENVLNEDQTLLKNVKQIGMEIHPASLTLRRDKLWSYIHRLRCSGFRQVHSEINAAKGNIRKSDGRTVSCCYELVWANEAFY